MEERIIKYIHSQLLLNKAVDTEVDKAELFEFAKKIGMKVTSKTSKKDVVERIFNSKSKHTFLLEVKDRFKVPAFSLAKIYDLTQPQINLLSDHNVIVEDYSIHHFQNRKTSESFEARVFNVESLKYDKEYLHERIKELEQNDLKIRIEVKDESIINELMCKINEVFKQTSEFNIYENKKMNSFYIYTTAAYRVQEKENDQC